MMHYNNIFRKQNLFRQISTIDLNWYVNVNTTINYFLLLIFHTKDFSRYVSLKLIILLLHIHHQSKHKYHET